MPQYNHLCLQMIHLYCNCLFKTQAMNRSIFFFWLITGILMSEYSHSQGYLHASGRYIYDGNNQEVILRGIGTGNWFLQEGYMMKTDDFAGTQHQIRQKMIETFGVANTDTFYESWLVNHFTRRDADSMAAWGFNSVRVAMHYKWLTLPIEDEPVAGVDTWLEDGFIRLDSLLAWCSDNHLYLILDLHGAPGGQGHDANISDYDATKPSLWESAENRRKTVALWQRLAQRYANEPWIGGYDLINEPNWDLPGGTMLKQLYQSITTAIRAVDNNHLIIIEGNWFANDYTGLTPPWDNNMVYSFHKYWTYNDAAALNWMINLRTSYNVPIWLGESGENSNSWFTDLIKLAENNRIGWSWWPVKKDGINNVLKVTAGRNYDDLLSYWKTGSPVLTAEQAFSAAMEWSVNHRIENCQVRRDVIDAMIRQPHSNETLPFELVHPGDYIHAVNYDLGKSSFAYHDTDSANYHLNTNTYTNWNQGWEYRNDGVDIEKCSDINAGNNGYSVGWTADGEWMQYTIQADTFAAYKVGVRSASASGGAQIHLELDGTAVSPRQILPSTGGWQTWNTSNINNVILPAGMHKLKVYFDKGGSNFNYLVFTNPIPVSAVDFTFLTAETNHDGNQISVTLNKEIASLSPVPADFQIVSAGNAINILSVSVDPSNNRKLILELGPGIRYQHVIKISYTGTSVTNGDAFLTQFSNQEVVNRLYPRFSLPATIQAEDFFFNNGFSLEDCTDTGWGFNIAYANTSDYLDYLIYVPQAGEYTLNLRFATQSSSGRLEVRTNAGGSFAGLGTVYFPSTGGWQTWSNYQIKINLAQGDQTLRLYVLGGEFNINWFSISMPNSSRNLAPEHNFRIFPNPGDGLFHLTSDYIRHCGVQVNVCSIEGSVLLGYSFRAGDIFNAQLDLTLLPKGTYIVQLNWKGITSSLPVVII